MSVPFLLGTDYLRKTQSVRPENLVSLWPQNEPLGHGVSTEVIRGYNGAYTAVTLGQPGVQGSGLTSAGYDGATSFNNIYTAGFANDNLLSNPGFETAGAGDPDFWANWTEGAGDGALANEVVVIHEGVDAAKLTSGASANTYVYGDTGVNLTPNTRYRLRFWTQGDGVNAGRYGIYDNTNGDWIQTLITTGVTGAAYEMVAYEFTTPPLCQRIIVYLYGPTANGGICYFDACEVRRMDGFLGDQGTVIVPAQVSGVGVWTDGTTRTMVHVGVDGNNYIDIERTAVNNTIQFDYVAGGVAEAQATAALANLDFATYGMTWDMGAGATGEVMYYIDGVASGATDVALGTWLGDVAVASAVIGAGSTVPADVWSGNEGAVPFWSVALTPDEMRYLG